MTRCQFVSCQFAASKLTTDKLTRVYREKNLATFMLSFAASLSPKSNGAGAAMLPDCHAPDETKTFLQATKKFLAVPILQMTGEIFTHDEFQAPRRRVFRFQ